MFCDWLQQTGIRLCGLSLFFNCADHCQLSQALSYIKWGWVLLCLMYFMIWESVFIYLKIISCPFWCRGYFVSLNLVFHKFLDPNKHFWKCILLFLTALSALINHRYEIILYGLIYNAVCECYSLLGCEGMPCSRYPLTFQRNGPSPSSILITIHFILDESARMFSWSVVCS